MTAAQYAPAVMQAGKDLGISPKGIQIGFATVYVESDWVMYANAAVPDSMTLPHDAVGSDGFSVGLFQQQVVMGDNGWWWGDAATCMDPYKSAQLFFTRLAAARIGEGPNAQDYNTDATTPGGWAQMVQQSEFPARYDLRMGDAVALYNRLSGGTVTPQPVGPPPFTETDLTQNNNNCESRDGYAPRLIILHTEEGSMQGSAFEEWMANNGVSYGYIINPDGSVIDMETDDVGSWSVLDPANEFSINICFATSTVNWSRQQWLDNMAPGINSAAYLAVRKCLAFNIPTQILVGKDYPRVVKEGGITDHNAITVTQLSPGSTHTDVGPNFPWDVFAAQIAQYTPNQPAPPQTPGFTYPSTDDMIKQIWEQLFGPQATGWPGLFGTTTDGARGKYAVEALGDIHQKDAP